MAHWLPRSDGMVTLKLDWPATAGTEVDAKLSQEIRGLPMTVLSLVRTTETLATPVCGAWISKVIGRTWPAVNFWTLAVLSAYL